MTLNSTQLQNRIETLMEGASARVPNFPPQDNENSSSPRFTTLLSVLLPICVLAFLALAVVGFRSWRSYHPKTKANKKSKDPEADIEPTVKENRLQNAPGIIEVHGFDVHIVEEKEFNRNSIIDSRTEPCVCDASPLSDQVFLVESKCVGLNDPEQENNPPTSGNRNLERPNTLKFLAASVAFQASTVPALKRLPYTPDPDCTLSDSPPESAPIPVPIEIESKDKVAPLAQPPRRMKPRGLLERRGSNVALTISLRPDDDSSTSTSSSSNLSPKPIAYLQKATSVLEVDDLHQISCDTNRLQKEFWSIPMNHPSEKSFNVPGHGTKNRHRILPNNHSRVKLPQLPGEDQLSTYINANYIRDSTDLQPSSSLVEDELSPVPREKAAFIATQGPLANTIEDFWRMIWQEKVASIVMLTKLKERKEKCAQYFPVNVGEQEKYGKLTVRVINVKKHEHFTVSTMEVSCEGETRLCCHFWYTTWMDHETPEKTRGLLEMVQEVSVWDKAEHGPIVVHCSAGIGRTGCYIAVFVGCQQLTKTGKADVLKIVSQMRLDRGGMVQTWEQYQFVHQALSRYGRILAGENVTTPSTSGSIRTPKLVSGIVSTPVGPYSPKLRRSTSDTAMFPSPDELEASQTNSSALHGSVKGDCGSFGKRRTADRVHTPHLFSSRTSLQLNKSESPTVRSSFERMCLQTKDLNAGTTPLSPKFRFPATDSQNGERMASKNKLEVNQNSPRKFKFSFTTLALSPAIPNCGQMAPVSGNKVSDNCLFTFDLPATAAKTILTNGFLEDHSALLSAKNQTTPRSNLSAKSASPHSGRSCTHFVFPSPSTR